MKLHLVKTSILLSSKLQKYKVQSIQYKMKQNQQEPLRLNVYIRAVWLAVKFSCKLSFVLKNDLSEVLADTESSYPLARGQAIVNEYLSCPLPTDFYAPNRKIRIFVYLVSANGIVPAGFATLPSQNKQKASPFSYMLPLERCDDPKAQIKLIVNVGHGKQMHFSSNTKNDSKRFASPINSIDNYREISRASYSATKVQYSRQRNSVPLFSNLNYKQKLKLGNSEPKIQKQPDSQLSRQQLIKQHQEYWVQIVRMQGQNQTLKEEIASLKNNSQKLRNQVESLGIENERMRIENQKVNALASQITQYSQTIAKLQAQLFSAKENFQNSQNQCYALTQELKRTQLELKEALQQTNKLSQKIQAQINENQANKQALQHLKWQNEHIAQNIQNISKENQELKHQNSAQNNQNQRLKGQVQSLQCQNINLKHQTDQLKRNQQLGKVNISHLTSELGVEKEKSKLIQNQVQQLKGQSIRKKQELFGQIQLNALLKQTLQSKDSQLTQMCQLLEHAKFQNANLAEKIDILSEQKRKLQGQASYQNLTIAQLQININTYRSKQKQLQTEAVLLEQNVQDSVSRQESQRLAYLSLIKEKQEHATAVERRQVQLRQQLFHLQNSNQALVEKLKLAQHTHQALKSQVVALRQKNHGLQQEFQLISQVLNKQQQEKQSFIDSITELQQVRQECESKKAKMQKQQSQQTELYKQIEQQLVQVNSSKEIAQSTLRVLQQNLRQSTHQKNILYEQLVASNAESLTYKNRINEAQNELQTLQLQLSELKQKQACPEYYSSYNKSITEMTMSQMKLEKENNELERKYEQLKFQSDQKEKELNELKQFTKNTLQETLKLRKERQDYEAKLTEATRK